MINWLKVSKFETEIISKISMRAKALGYPDDLITINMDITAAHIASPLKLDELLNADNENFMHDVFGIRKHINRKTGNLDGIFAPRFAL